MNVTTIRTSLEDVVSSVASVRFEPGRDTLLAVASVFALWPIYYANSTTDSTVALVAFLLVGNLLLTVLVPIYYVGVVRDESLSAVGITARGWKRALVASTLVAIAFLPGLLAAGGELPTSLLLAHVITIGLMFWEPFFVHGWLQLRFERAFGPIPGIVLASGGFVAFHLGVRSPESLFVLLLVGLFHGVLFRVAGGNLLVLWPVMWAIASGQGTLESGLVFGWEEASAYAVILVVIAVGIWLVERRNRERIRDVT
ncbi:hypothetical protein AB7C87_19575 [Natrarchaeobius sp. A-rgal3]|uniref:CPBP family glutamic-type intramembrane protease n=1 Tax=Natrarchaeobius versutus TaxID=1679078 RepID=UPI00350F25EE